MSEEEIERELQRLVPAAPSEALLARLRQPPSPGRRIIRFPGWWPLAAAACALVFLLLRPIAPPRHPAVPSVTRLETFRPVETDRFLISARDLGVVELEPGRPYRLVHCVWADRETFRSEGSASHLEVRQAREQIVPLSLTVL